MDSLFYAGRQVDRPPQQDAPGPHVSGAPLQAQVKVAPPLTSSISERSNCFRVSLFRDNFLLVFFIYDPPLGWRRSGLSRPSWVATESRFAQANSRQNVQFGARRVSTQIRARE